MYALAVRPACVTQICAMVLETVMYSRASGKGGWVDVCSHYAFVCACRILVVAR